MTLSRLLLPIFCCGIAAGACSPNSGKVPAGRGLQAPVIAGVDDVGVMLEWSGNCTFFRLRVATLSTARVGDFGMPCDSLVHTVVSTTGDSEVFAFFRPDERGARIWVHNDRSDELRSLAAPPLPFRPMLVFTTSGAPALTLRGSVEDLWDADLFERLGEKVRPKRRCPNGAVFLFAWMNNGWKLLEKHVPRCDSDEDFSTLDLTTRVQLGTSRNYFEFMNSLRPVVRAETDRELNRVATEVGFAVAGNDARWFGDDGAAASLSYYRTSDPHLGDYDPIIAFRSPRGAIAISSSRDAVQLGGRSGDFLLINSADGPSLVDIPQRKIVWSNKSRGASAFWIAPLAERR